MIDKPKSHRFKDIQGKKFNLLYVKEYAGIKKKNAYWLCECDCGKSKVLQGSDVSSGRRMSCGCYYRTRLVKHGHTIGGESSEYLAWCNMKTRCYYKEYNQYYRYGGRGIKVCDRWLDSFENFLFDMGKKPSPKHSLDRIDNDGNYEPSNCRWSTPKQQIRNSNIVRLITYNGETKSIVEWSKILGINPSTIKNRLNYGFSLDVVFSKHIYKPFEIKNKKKTLIE